METTTRSLPVQSTSTDNSSIRKASILAGAALAAMAVIAPLGVMVALPAGRLDVATLVVLVVVSLDVMVSVALFFALRAAGDLIVGIAVAMRLVYAAIFAAAAGELAQGDDAAFQATWDAGLLIFGLHLVLIGVAVIRAVDMSTWVGAIVILAGAGYVFDAVSVLLWSDNAISVGEFTFIGEVVLLVWLLGWGRQGSPSTVTT